MYPTTFSTPRLVFRPLVADDAAAIFASYGQDAGVTRYLSWRPHASVADAERFVQMCLTAETSRTYAIVLRDTDTLIGVFDLRARGATTLEYGCVLARAFWGRGLMTEAVAAVAEWALAQPATWRFGAVADAENVASLRVMEKAGLAREGVLRRWLVCPNISDVPRDCVSFAKTR